MLVILTDGKDELRYQPLPNGKWLQKPFGSQFRSSRARQITAVGLTLLLGNFKQERTATNAVYYAATPRQLYLLGSGRVKF